MLNFNLDFYGFTLMIKDSNAKLIWDGQEYTVSLPEALILKELINNTNELVSRKRLIETAWGSCDFIGGNSLPVAISNLRKVLKIKNISIINEPKVGYRLEISDNLLIESSAKEDLINNYGFKFWFSKLYIGVEILILFFILVVISDFLFAWVFVEHYDNNGVHIYELGEKRLILGVNNDCC